MRPRVVQDSLDASHYPVETRERFDTRPESSRESIDRSWAIRAGDGTKTTKPEAGACLASGS
jgi:hypothetical protein